MGNTCASIATALVCALASTSAFAQGLPTTGTIEPPIGKLEIKNGYPRDKTVTKLYDTLDFERATQADIWALPYMAMAEWQREQRETFDAGDFDYVEYLDFKDKLGILTANATTPYAMAFPNLEKTGLLVFEIPDGAMAGGIMDFWEPPLTDTGMIGPDKGQGRSSLSSVHDNRTLDLIGITDGVVSNPFIETAWLRDDHRPCLRSRGGGVSVAID